MTLYVLDTDIMGFAFQQHPTVLRRLPHLPEDDPAVTTIITFDKETRMDLDAFRQPLQGLFQQHPVRLAYLFGSQATRRTHPSSDVDIAVLLDKSLTSDERFTEWSRLLGDLSRIFGTDHVDLVMLNEASPLLAYETLRHGVLLYCADAQTRSEFQVRTLRAYEDTIPLRRILSEAMAVRLKAGTFGKPVLTKNRGR